MKETKHRYPFVSCENERINGERLKDFRDFRALKEDEKQHPTKSCIITEWPSRPPVELFLASDKIRTIDERICEPSLIQRKKQTPWLYRAKTNALNQWELSKTEHEIL